MNLLTPEPMNASLASCHLLLTRIFTLDNIASNYPASTKLSTKISFWKNMRLQRSHAVVALGMYLLHFTQSHIT